MNAASAKGLRLRLLRQEAALSLAELARRCRISSRRLENIERGDQRATNGEAQAVEIALDKALTSGSRLEDGLGEIGRLMTPTERRRCDRAGAHAMHSRNDGVAAEAEA